MRSISPLWLFVLGSFDVILLFAGFAQYLFFQVVPGAAPALRSTSMAPVTIDFSRRALRPLKLLVPEAFITSRYRGDGEDKKLSLLLHWPTGKPTRVIEHERGLEPVPLALVHPDVDQENVLISLPAYEYPGEVDDKGFQATRREQIQSDVPGLLLLQYKSCPPSAECRLTDYEYYVSSLESGSPERVVIKCDRRPITPTIPARCRTWLPVGPFHADVQFLRPRIQDWQQIISSAQVLLKSIVVE